MAYWLFKEEPEHYSFDDLVRDKKATWNGVENNLALKHLRSVKKGDHIFYYHTGKEKSVVGVMEAMRDSYADPDDADGRLVVVDVKPVRKLAHPVTLAAIKADSQFADFALVRMARLSVMPVTPDQWKRIESMAKK